MKQKTALTISLLSALTICWLGGFYYGTHRQEHLNLEAVVLKQEPSHFKANLMMVIGTHYAGADEELGGLLQNYAQEKMRQLNDGGVLANEEFEH